MKKAVFGLQEKRGPWTFNKTRKTRFRDIFHFRGFGIFNDFPIPGPPNKKNRKIDHKKFMKKKARVPPLARGGSGGGPPIPGAARN